MQKESTATQLPKWFWIIAVLAVLWNLVGVAAYVYGATISEAALAALPAAERQLHEATPGWVFAAFAVAVFAGLAGSIALVLRRSLAAPVFATSLIAVVAQTTYVLALSPSLQLMGASAAAMPLTITAIAAGLLWFSFVARRRGWLR